MDQDSRTPTLDRVAGPGALSAATEGGAAALTMLKEVCFMRAS